MFRKMLIILIMGPILGAAAITGTSLPVLLVMAGLIVMALAAPSTHEERQG